MVMFWFWVSVLGFLVMAGGYWWVETVRSRQARLEISRLVARWRRDHRILDVRIGSRAFAPWAPPSVWVRVDPGLSERPVLVSDPGITLWGDAFPQGQFYGAPIPDLVPLPEGEPWPI